MPTVRRRRKTSKTIHVNRDEGRVGVWNLQNWL